MDRIQHKIYIFSLCVFAAITYSLVLHSFGYDIDIKAIIFWGVLATISETFHILLPSGVAITVGMAVYLGALVSAGPIVATTLPIIAFLFRVPEVEGERWHVLKYKPSVVLYNMMSHIIFIGVISTVYQLIAKDSDDLSIIIVTSLVVLTLGEFISFIQITLYFYTKDKENELPTLKSFFGALPSTWAVGALGIFLAFAAMNYDEAIVGLFFIPLLLARYSFKLYFDSQKMGMETIHALNEALFVRDQYTAGHTERVEEYAVMIAKTLNYSQEALSRLKKSS